MAHRVCNGCGKRFEPVGKASRCDACAADVPPRADLEPWRMIYSRPEWFRARSIVMQRDGEQCRGQWRGVRCPVRIDLQVHHRRKLRDLWLEADSRGDFVRVACEPHLLVTLCPRCHAAAERAPDPLD